MRYAFVSSLTFLLVGAASVGMSQTASPYSPVSGGRVVSVATGGVAGNVPGDTSPGTDQSGGKNASCSTGSCANDSCCSCPEPCGPPGRFWVSAEYLYWWIKDSNTPPLVTVSPRSSAGILGMPGTTVLFGGDEIDNEGRSGGRFTLGYWLDEEQTIGIEGSYFFLSSRSINFAADVSNTNTAIVLARPFFNVITGMEDSQIVPGSIRASLSSRLQGADVNGIYNLCCGCCYRLDLLAGFQYLQLDEGLGITENFTVAPNVPIIGGTAFALADQFDARTNFYGGQIGARAEVRRCNFFVDLLATVGLGDSHEMIDINGMTIITPPNGPRTVATGGLLALPTNIGQFSRDRFAVKPEVGINVGYQVTKHLRTFVGYTFLYLSDAVRPGDQIDRAINPTQLPLTRPTTGLVGPARPAVLFNDTDFWAQGLSWGVELRY